MTPESWSLVHNSGPHMTGAVSVTTEAKSDLCMVFVLLKRQFQLSVDDSKLWSRLRLIQMDILLNKEVKESSLDIFKHYLV